MERGLKGRGLLIIDARQLVMNQAIVLGLAGKLKLPQHIQLDDGKAFCFCLFLSLFLAQTS